MLTRMLSVSTLGLLLAGTPGLVALDFEDASHFLERTGFGAPPRSVLALSALSRQEAVDSVISGLRTDPPGAPPAWCAPPLPEASG